MDTVRISPVSDAAAIRFPRFTEFPKNLHHFSYKNEVFAPRSFALEQTGTPWLLFDDQQRTVVLSPRAPLDVRDALSVFSA
jgi:hypothetical protein